VKFVKRNNDLDLDFLPVHYQHMKKLIRYRILITLTIYSLCICYGVPPFHAYYYSEPPFIHYFLISSGTQLLYLLPSNKFLFFEKLLYASLVAIGALFVAGFLVSNAMDYLYGSDTNWDKLKSPELLDSTLFYIASYLIGIGTFTVVSRYKKPLYS